MIYLHLGLHKTATTSFQESIFPYLEGIFYLGRQVSSIEHNSFYQELCRYCFSMEVNLDTEIKLKSKLSKIESEYGNILISDEWFTADYSLFYSFNGAIWQVKLDKISRIVKGLNHKVLISLRKVEDALYSQYCEFCSVGIDKLYPNFIDYVKESNDAILFNYLKLNDILVENFDSVDYLPFSLIRNGKYERFIINFFDVKAINKLTKTNIKIKNSKGTEVTKSNDLIIFIMGILPVTIKKLLENVQFLKKMKVNLRKIVSSKLIVKNITENELEYVKTKYSDSNLFYKKLDIKFSEIYDK
jgi:hypothetical protein